MSLEDSAIDEAYKDEIKKEFLGLSMSLMNDNGPAGVRDALTRFNRGMYLLKIAYKEAKDALKGSDHKV